MNFILSTYRAVSFRGRLLLLLVTVSLIQAGVAAYTFSALQARPVDERVSAQLNGNLRAVAPVLDQQVRAASIRMQQLSTPALADAIANKDIVKLNQLLAVSSDSTDSTGLVGATSTSSTSSAATGTAATGSKANGIGSATSGNSTSTSTSITPYITDATSTVIAGRRPEGILLEQQGVNVSRLVREDSTYVGELHLPIVIDQSFVRDRLSPYSPGGEYKTFFVSGGQLVDENGVTGTKLHLHDGLQTVKIDGKKHLVLVQSVLKGTVKQVATVPSSFIASAKHKNMSSLYGFIFVLLLMTLIESVAISRAVSQALHKFASLARQLADGDLTRRIPVTGRDEVALLGDSFNTMAENLEVRIENLIEARAKLRRQVELFGDALANATEIGDMLRPVLGLALESTVATHARFWTIGEDGECDHAACIGLRPQDTEPSKLERNAYIRNGVVHGGEQAPWWIVVPARSGDMIIGLMTLVSTNEQFSEDDVRLAERLAVQAAVAIDNARLHEILRLQATLDGLTGLPNHRSLQDQLHIWLDSAFAKKQPLGLALLDIDNFKRINDTYGHSIGDEAIKALAKVVSHGIGDMGMAARLGGEEFVVLMPGCDADASCRIADRLREDIAHIEVPLEDGSMLTFTASIGVSNVDQNATVIDNAEMLHQADTGLYNAKRTGKNKVWLAGPDTEVFQMTEVEQARLDARERGELWEEPSAEAAA